MNEDDVLWQLQRARTPVTLRDLAQWCHLSRRDVEAAVQALRLRGEPIVSSAEGIRLTTDPAEVNECATALRRRLVTQYRTCRAMQNTARRLSQTEQVTLW